MTSPVAGEGFIIIRPDLSRFEDELRRGVNRALDVVADDFRMFERFVNQLFEDLADDIVYHMRYMDRVLNRIFANLARDARECGYTIAASFTLASRIAREELDELEDRAQRAFRNIRQAARGSGFSIVGMFRNFGRSILSSLSGLFGGGGGGGGGPNPAGAAQGAGALSGIMGNLSGIGGMIGSIAQIAIMAAILPLIIQLGAALLNLVGILAALPAAAGVAVAAFVPLKIAFNGVGEALAAIWSGDPEAIAEAMKKLAPPARNVVKEFAKFVPTLKQLGPLIQKNFFTPLQGQFTKLGNTIIPTLNKSIGSIATTWGNAVAQMINWIAIPEFSSAIENIITTANNIIARFGPTMGSFFQNIIMLINKGLPFVQRFAFWIANLVDKFNAWLAMSTQSGKVTGWLETAWNTGKQLYELIKELVVFVGLMFGAFSDEGTDTMDGLGESIKKVNEYLRSPEGQEALHNLGVVIHWVGNAWVWFIANMTVAYDGLNALFSFIRSVGPFIMGLVNQWKDGWKSVWEWTKNAWAFIKEAVLSGWNAVIAFLVNNWTSLKKLFVDGWNSLTSTVSNFVTNTRTWLSQLPGDIKRAIVDSIHNAAYNFGYAIGTIIAFFLRLPQTAREAGAAIWNALVTAWNAVTNFFTQTIPALAANVGQWFADMWNNAYNTVANFVTNSVSTVSELPARFGQFIESTRSRVSETFTGMRNSAVERVRGLVSGARDEASKLPGQVASAISSVISRTYDIGRDMIFGMINGIRSAARALWNAARDVVMDAWQGAKDALKSRSPSKKWAELGEDSAAGYQMGWSEYNLIDSMKSAIQMPLNAFNRANQRTPTPSTSVQVGGASITAYLQIGDDQLRPVVVTTIKEHPQEVALATQQGNTQLARRR